MTPMELLLLDCSPRRENSTSRHLGRALLAGLAPGLRRDVRLTERRIGTEPLPPISAGYAEALLLPVDEARARHGDSLAVSDTLIAELDRADLLIIATPVHNFTVPAALKTWIDYVVRREVTFRTTPQGKLGLLRDRPVLVAVTSGGAMFAEPARQPDFFRPYLRAALGVIGLHDVSFATSTGLAFSGAPRETVEADASAWLAQGLDALGASAVAA